MGPTRRKLRAHRVGILSSEWYGSRADRRIVKIREKNRKDSTVNEHDTSLARSVSHRSAAIRDAEFPGVYAKLASGRFCCDSIETGGGERTHTTSTQVDKSRWRLLWINLSESSGFDSR